MKHLLLACYFYPPDGGSGVQRPLSIARHAAASGWRVTVLTRGGAKQRGLWDPEDPSLVGRFEHVREVRVPVPEGSTASQMIAPKDGRRDPWLVTLVKQAVELHASDPIDHALVTMPPYGMADLAGMLQDACPGVPVSVDLRDPWAFDGAFAYGRKALWRQNKAVMRRTLGRVDGVVVNTPEVLSRVRDTFTELDPSKLEVVTNGYETELFEGPQPAQPGGYRPGCLHLVHVGTLHSDAVLKRMGIGGWLRNMKNYRAEPADLVGRTALPILNAIGRLKRQGDRGVDQLRLVLVGVDDPATRKIAEGSGCADQVMMTGYMAHEEAVAWLRWADCLFLPLFDLPQTHRSLIVPGKTYEYLASQKPILGALPLGDARAFVEQSGRGYLARPTRVDELADRLSEVIEAYQKGTLPAGEPARWACRFSRSELTARLCVFLTRVSDRHKQRADALTPLR